MSPLAIVEALPNGQLLFQLFARCLEVNGGPELHAISALRAFDLTVEVRRSRTVRPELDTLLAQGVLKRGSDELTAPVALDALYGKGKLLDQMLTHKVGGVGGGSARIERQNTHPSAVINSGELIQVLADLTGVYLDTVAWNGTRVALGGTRVSRRTQNRDAMPMQHLPDRARGKAQLMQAQQFALQTFGAQAPGAP